MDGLAEPVRWALATPVYALAYGVAIFVFWWMARRRGLDTAGVRLLMSAGLIGGLVGANVAQFVLAGAPGKTIEGGIAGGFIAVVLMKRRLGIVRPVGDLFAPAIAIGEAIGRIGCFIGGCCYGKVASVALAVHDHGADRYPTQLYTSAAAFATFGLLMVLERRKVLPENGLFYVQISLFCLTRFALEFFREGSALQIGVTTAQLGCVAGIAYALWKLAPLMTRRVAGLAT
jgi:phosphatidylglycerol:prolipoprotein diacylglycerol transferase